MIKTVCVVIVVLMCAGAADAATKCIKLDANTTGSDYDFRYGQSDWTVTERDGTVLRGAGVCSDQIGSRGQISDTITLGSSNTYCWCKMTSPAVSAWVFHYHAESAGVCASNCGRDCAGYACTNSDFRVAMFGSIAQ